MVVFIKTFDQYPHEFNFGHFFSRPINLLEDLNLKRRSKFNHNFTNHGCSPCAILKTQPFKHQPHKMVKHSQTIYQQIPNKLFECVWPLCEVGA